MQNVAQAWLVYRLTHSELLLGTAWFCTQIPVFALGSLGGLASDRYSRWKLVVLTQTLSLVQALGLALLTLSGRVQVWHVLAFRGHAGLYQCFRYARPAIADDPHDQQGRSAERDLAQLRRCSIRHASSDRPSPGWW